MKTGKCQQNVLSIYLTQGGVDGRLTVPSATIDNFSLIQQKLRKSRYIYLLHHFSRSSWTDYNHYTIHTSPWACFHLWNSFGKKPLQTTRRRRDVMHVIHSICQDYVYCLHLITTTDKGLFLPIPVSPVINHKSHSFHELYRAQIVQTCLWNISK